MTSIILAEERAEVMALTDLASNLSDGMKLLTAANISRPIKTFGEPIPPNMVDADEYAERFIAWQVGRLTEQQVRATWSHPDALEDVRKYVRRKVWQIKIESGDVIHPVAKMLATTVHLHRKYRADVHEALNHAAKHNTDVKALGQEMREQLDEVVRARLEETTQAIAGVALVTLPQLQQAITAGRLTHEQ